MELCFESKLRGEERRSDFSDKFLKGVGLIAVVPTEFTVKPGWMPCPMHTLMQSRRLVFFDRREMLGMRQVDSVVLPVVVRVGAAVANDSGNRGEEWIEP